MRSFSVGAEMLSLVVQHLALGSPGQWDSSSEGERQGKEELGGVGSGLVGLYLEGGLTGKPFSLGLVDPGKGGSFRSSKAPRGQSIKIKRQNTGEQSRRLILDRHAQQQY